MVLTKNLISRDEAFAKAPVFVRWIEENERDACSALSDKLWNQVNDAMGKMKRGQAAVTWHDGMKRGLVGDGSYVLVKVSSVDHESFAAIDGPVIRVSNGEYSWRVDGCDYAYPIK